MTLFEKQAAIRAHHDKCESCEECELFRTIPMRDDCWEDMEIVDRNYKILFGGLTVKNWNVYGLEESIAASKYPKSVDIDSCNSDVTKTVLNLAQCATGTGHDQFLTGIVVQFDLTFSIKAWVEAERYHFFDFVSSQSTMHKIAEFDIAAQCNEFVTPGVVAIVNELLQHYLEFPTPENYLRLLYNVPVGFCLTARMTTNYRQLKTIYQQRKNHRLPEWRDFCKWLETLPHSEFITGKGNPK